MGDGSRCLCITQIPDTRDACGCVVSARPAQWCTTLDDECDQAAIESVDAAWQRSVLIHLRTSNTLRASSKYGLDLYPQIPHPVTSIRFHSHPLHSILASAAALEVEYWQADMLSKAPRWASSVTVLLRRVNHGGTNNTRPRGSIVASAAGSSYTQELVRIRT